jgi:hypothetical protein
MLVGLEVGRQVAAAALLAVSSVVPGSGALPPAADPPAACAPASTVTDAACGTASPGSATSGTGTTTSSPAGSPCAAPSTGPATGAPAAPVVPTTTAVAPAATSGTTIDVTEDAAGTGARRYPAQLIALDDWKLTLPTGGDDGPQEIEQPELATYTSEYFRLDDGGTGVVFRAEVGGTTTENSSYPRSELREMDGADKASWSNTSGTHTLRVRQAVTALPPVKPHVVTAQIHDAEDDVVEVRLEGEHLLVEYDDGDGEVTLDPAYVLGTPYDLEIVAAGGRVQVAYNGAVLADIPKRGSGWYFKSGSYVQSNLIQGDDPGAVGEVVLYALEVSHES